ncbi:DUF4446 family protein [Patescibacteria group bacterium]|nr:DUF4446 family protein [Patescibacteria group bacterium]
MNVIYVILAVLAIWLLALTVFFIIFRLFFARLVKGTKQEDLKKTLEAILALEDKNASDLIKVDREIKRLEDDGKFHVQKMGLVRFNPFKETGGDHSFSLVLLDAKDTGVVITGLHTRERTRVYLKSVKEGRPEFELSEEEKKALFRAQRG